jgi:MFS family permease
MVNTQSTRRAEGTRLRVGYWAVAFAFTAAMAFTTLPTPLWSIYARRDHFSSLTVTVAFAVYAIAVAISLFLAGHLSDWHGRRRLLIPALALNLVAAAVFVTWPALPGLVMARGVSGLGIGVVTATATAWLAELSATRRPGVGPARANVIATTANLGGLGLGGLISGVLAQWVGDRLTLPFLVLAGALVLAEIGLLIAPETRGPRRPRPRYRPQQVSVPPSARGRFFAAAIGAGVAFSVFGLATSLAPSFLADTLHESSYALAGAVAFEIFASAAVAQILSPSSTAVQLRAAIPTLLGGLALLTAAVWVPSGSLAIFLAGGLVVGVGAGLMFKGAIGTVTVLAPQDRRAEALAGLFLAAYVGLAGPVIGLGALTQVAPMRVSLLVFAASLALVILLAAPALLDRRGAGIRKLQPVSR